MVLFSPLGGGFIDETQPVSGKILLRLTFPVKVRGFDLSDLDALSIDNGRIANPPDLRVMNRQVTVQVDVTAASEGQTFRVSVPENIIDGGNKAASGERRAKAPLIIEITNDDSNPQPVITREFPVRFEFSVPINLESQEFEPLAGRFNSDPRSDQVVYQNLNYIPRSQRAQGASPRIVTARVTPRNNFEGTGRIRVLGGEITAANDNEQFNLDAELEVRIDTKPPELLSSTLTGQTLVLTFHEPLDLNSVPAASAFTVNVDDTIVALASTDPVVLADNTITLTLAEPVTWWQSEVALDYRKPSSPAQDLYGNDVLNFNGRSINNQTPNNAPTAIDSEVQAQEDVPFTFSQSDFGFSDPDFSSVATDLASAPDNLRDTLERLRIETLPTAGTLSDMNGPLAAGDEIDGSDLDAITFTPAANGNGDGYAQFTFRVGDAPPSEARGLESDNEATMTIDVTPVNDPATGKPVITGFTARDEVLTALIDGIADVEGLPSSPSDFEYQWIRTDADGMNPQLINGATSPEYTLIEDDVGGRVQVELRFTDGGGVEEMLISDVYPADGMVAGVNRAAPRVTSIMRQDPATSPTNADELTWRVVFSKTVTNVDETDFVVRVVDSTAPPLTVTTSQVMDETGAWDIKASGDSLVNLNGRVILRFAPRQNIGDTAGNVLAETKPTEANEDTYVLDNTAPRVTSIARQDPATSSTNADKLTWRVTFDESVREVTADDFALTVTTSDRVFDVTAMQSVAEVPGETGIWDVTASGGDLSNLDATVTLRFAPDQGIADLAGNALSSTIPTQSSDPSFTLDNTAPTGTITGVPANSDAPFTATIMFSEPVTEFVQQDIIASNATLSEFAPVGTDGTVPTAAWTVKVAPMTEGEVTLDIAADVAEDAAGNGNKTVAQATLTFDLPDPIVRGPDGAPVVVVDDDGLTLDFRFDLDKTRDPPASKAFMVAVDEDGDGENDAEVEVTSVDFGRFGKFGNVVLGLDRQLPAGVGTVIYEPTEAGQGARLRVAADGGGAELDGFTLTFEVQEAPVLPEVNITYSGQYIYENETAVFTLTREKGPRTEALTVMLSVSEGPDIEATFIAGMRSVSIRCCASSQQDRTLENDREPHRDRHMRGMPMMSGRSGICQCARFAMRMVCIHRN